MAVGGQSSVWQGNQGAEGVDKSGHGSGVASPGSGERGVAVCVPGGRGGVAAHV